MAYEIETMISLAESLRFSYNIDPQITARHDGGRGPLGLRVDRPTLEALYGGPLRGLISAPDCSPERSVQCSCAQRPFCSRSSGVIYTNTGDYTGPARFGDDWTCMEASVRRSLHERRQEAQGHQALVP